MWSTTHFFIVKAFRVLEFRNTSSNYIIWSYSINFNTRRKLLGVKHVSAFILKKCHLNDVIIIKTKIPLPQGKLSWFWLACLGPFVFLDVVFKCLRQHSNGLKENYQCPCIIKMSFQNMDCPSIIRYSSS
jgi:hypothetical protein